MFDGDDAFADTDGDGVGVGLVPPLATAGKGVVAPITSDENDTFGTSEVTGGGELGLDGAGKFCAVLVCCATGCCDLLAGGIYALALRFTPAYLAKLDIKAANNHDNNGRTCPLHLRHCHRSSRSVLPQYVD